MEWRYDENLPIYSQLVELLKHAIVSGEYAAGERLPSVRDMAAEAGVNPNTMQRALQELERSGLVYTQRNNGRFVTEELPSIDGARNELADKTVRNFLEKMTSLGFSVKDAVSIITKYQEEDNNDSI